MKRVSLLLFLFFLKTAYVQSQSITLVGRSLTQGQSLYTTDLVRVIPGELGNQASGVSPAVEVIEFIITNLDQETLVNIVVTFAKDGSEIARGTRRTVSISPGTLRITNLDFLKFGGKFYLNNFATNLRTLNDAIFRGSATRGDLPELLPNGIYTFSLEFFNPETETSLARSDVSFAINNNTGYIELISPGTKFGNSQIDEVQSSFPVFNWVGDAHEYEITIWEDVRNIGYFNDVVNTIPHAKQTVVGTVYQYEATHRQLVPGNVYFWQVKAKIPTLFREPRYVKSEPYVFKLAKKNLRSDYSTTEEKIFNILSSIYEMDEKVLKGASILEFRAVWGKDEVTSKNIEFLLKLLKK